MCDLAQRAGVKWSREEILWDRTEPREGEFDWAFYDRMVEIARAPRHQRLRPARLLVRLGGQEHPSGRRAVLPLGPAGRAALQGPHPSLGGLERAEHLLLERAARELYAELLTSGVRSDQGRGPDAIVMGCSTAGIDHDFIKKVMGWGGKFDALTIHPYRGSLEEVGFMQELRDVKELVGGRPVWLTEIGFPSEQRTAGANATRPRWSPASTWPRWPAGRPSTSPGTTSATTATTRSTTSTTSASSAHDFAPKPAYRALATLGRTLGGMQCAGPVDIGEGAYAFRFNRTKVKPASRKMWDRLPAGQPTSSSWPALRSVGGCWPLRRTAR